MATTKKYLGTTALRRLVSLIGTRIKSVESNLSSAKSSITSLGSRTSTLESYGTTLRNDMSGVKSRLSELEGVVSGYDLKEQLFADLWSAAGGQVYNYDDEDSLVVGVEFYELNGVTVDYSTAIRIWADREALSCAGVRQVRKDIPTNFVMPAACGMRGDDGDWAYRFLNCTVEVAAVPDNVAPERFDGCFWGCSKLTDIIGRIRLRKSAVNCSNAFKGCSKLTTVHLNELACDISFADCPALSDASIREMVNNAKGEAAITITVHPAVFALVKVIYGSSATVTSKKITFKSA